MYVIKKIPSNNRFVSGVSGIPKRKFPTDMSAYRYGIGKWGSGTYNVRGGWKVKKL